MITHFVCSKVFSRANICCPENEFLVTRSDDQDDVGGHHDNHDHDWCDYGHDLFIMLMPFFACKSQKKGTLYIYLSYLSSLSTCE